MEATPEIRCPAQPALLIRAAQMSSALALPASVQGGIVESVHRTSVNLRFGRQLVTIARAETGGLPNGVLVEASFDPIALALRPGLTVAADETAIVIDGRIRIDIAESPRWSPRLHPLPLFPGALRHRAGAARRASAACGPDGLGGILDSRDRAAELGRAIASGDEAEAVHAGRGLVGLGAGLTPSGDDLLVALSATLAVLGDPRATMLATAWAAGADERTTPVAASFHRHAASGEYSQRLHDVLAAILVGPTAAIPAAVSRAAAWGATSGVDALLGIAIALEAVTSHRPEAA